MNNRILTTTLLAGGILMATGCSDDSPFDANTNSNNDGLISQNNFTLLFSDPTPKFIDPATGSFTSVTSEISVQIGDKNNQLITGSHTIQFRTEWGLIDPSCTTKDGVCSVTWRSGSTDSMPADFFNTVIAFAATGEESYGDINGNGRFDDGDLFGTDLYADVEEPYVNSDDSGFINSNGSFVDTFTAGDTIIDTVNGLDLTGANESHDDGDLLFNGPDCSHSTLCSTSRARVTVWESGALWLNGGVGFAVGGTVTGLTGGTLKIQNNLVNKQDITADGPFTYSVLGGADYSVTVSTQPTGQTCTVTNGAGTATADITDIAINCI